MIRVRVIDWTDSDLAICDEWIWKEIRPYIVAGEPVVFDFVGINTLGAPFIHSCITKCLEILTVDEFCNSIRFERMQSKLVPMLERVINSHVQFMDTPRYYMQHLNYD